MGSYRALFARRLRRKGKSLRPVSFELLLFSVYSTSVLIPNLRSSASSASDTLCVFLRLYGVLSSSSFSEGMETPKNLWYHSMDLEAACPLSTLRDEPA
jgi:hypothetical protein